MQRLTERNCRRDADAPPPGRYTPASAAESVHIAIDEKPKRDDPRRLKRLRDIAENPRVMLLVDRYDHADRSRLGWLALRGRAEILDGGAEHARALAALRARYPPYRAMAPAALPVIAVRVESARSWGRPDAG